MSCNKNNNFDIYCAKLKELCRTCSEMQSKEVIYSKTINGTYQLSGRVKDFGSKVIDKGNRRIEEPNCVNGVFFMLQANGKTYPTSILYSDGIAYQSKANHLPYPQSVFIVNKDNTVYMKTIHNLNKLDLNKVKLAIGGVGLRNTLDKSFIYSPAAEGFSGKYSDVLRKANKTVIGYNKSEDKIYLMCRPSIYHKNAYQYDLLTLVKDCEYDIAISLDGGGSTFMNNATDMVLKGDGRAIFNIVGFNLN